MEEKTTLSKAEEFAKKIIRMAVEEKLTVGELYSATNMAKGISDNSAVEIESIEKADFPSQHAVTPTGLTLSITSYD